MHCFVTGGAGFIGSNLCERLIQDKNSIVCLDNFNTFYDPGIKRRNIHTLREHPHFRLIEGDILNNNLLDRIFNEEKFDVVVHLAARAGVRPSIQYPLLYQRVNVEGTTNLLDLASRFQIPKFILASSSSVYGNNSKVPFSEDDPVDFPISPYAATKKACELLAYTYFSLYSISVTCLRFFTVYGPRQRPDMAIHKFARCIINDEEIPFYGDGKSRRDYTYISDINDGIIAAIENCYGYHIYNLGESQTIHLDEMIQLLENVIGKKAKVNKLPDQPGDVSVTYADISKARKDLGYRPKVSIRDGIPKFIHWYMTEMT